MLTDSIAIDRVTSGQLSRGTVAQGGMRGACCSDCAGHGLGDVAGSGTVKQAGLPPWIPAALMLGSLAIGLYAFWPQKRRRQRQYVERKTVRLPAETMGQVVWERR